MGSVNNSVNGQAIHKIKHKESLSQIDCNLIKMASASAQSLLLRNSFLIGKQHFLKDQKNILSVISHNRKFTSGNTRFDVDTHGYIKPAPRQEPLVSGSVKILLVTCLGIYLGVNISKSMVKFLEEYEIFIPDEDEDDD